MTYGGLELTSSGNSIIVGTTILSAGGCPSTASRRRSGRPDSMRYIPSHLPQSVIDLVRWTDASDAPPLATDRVPGAEGDELSRLAALGALARELAPEAVDQWPEPLASWARDAVVTVDSSVLTAVRKSLDSSDHEILALAYEQIVSGVNRRQLGTFFTPPAIVRYMIEQSERLLLSPPVNVVDPGAGVGAFTTAALSAWPNAMVTAVDVNVVTLGLLAASASARDKKAESEISRLVLAPVDYLAWLQEQWNHLDGPRLILGNPPYTRHQRMGKKDKEAARGASGDLITSGLAGLSAYFLAATINALSASDAACFLLPASWCETRYGREIRQWLWESEKRTIETHFFPSEVDVFPGTQVTAMILLIGPSKPTKQPFIVREIGLPESTKNHAVSLRNTIKPDRRNGCPATFTELLRRPIRPSKQSSISLGEVAKIRRGVATGASEFFFLTDAQRDSIRLPHQALRRALMKPAHCTSSHLDRDVHDGLGILGLPRWLLDLNDTDLAHTDEFVMKYIAHGKSLKIHDRYLTRHRKEWYLVEPVRAPDLFLVPVGKPNHRVIANDVGAVGSNNLYGIYLSDDAPWSPEELAGWLRSADGLESLARLARHYHGGSLKIEPRALRTLKVPGTKELLTGQ